LFSLNNERMEECIAVQATTGEYVYIEFMDYQEQAEITMAESILDCRTGSTPDAFTSHDLATLHSEKQKLKR